ncbi:hypothetical protein K431DRAFT_88855 [Polychaeton citri CBS 116435]|uniref:Secreted protein n=1 Tax=Polychaeton citri CBS 116435 TaxID=1314669 RepID=A0A9P4Q4Z7_9PEZI|nr:hypothetical protein K431DRAFT_88855 [Polychaeton citri CBS 116435]
MHGCALICFLFVSRVPPPSTKQPEAGTHRVPPSRSFQSLSHPAVASASPALPACPPALALPCLVLSCLNRCPASGTLHIDCTALVSRLLLLPDTHTHTRTHNHIHIDIRIHTHTHTHTYKTTSILTSATHCHAPALGSPSAHSSGILPP